MSLGPALREGFSLRRTPCLSNDLSTHYAYDIAIEHVSDFAPRVSATGRDRAAVAAVAGVTAMTASAGIAAVAGIT